MRSKFSIRNRDNHAFGVTLGRYTLSEIQINLFVLLDYGYRSLQLRKTKNFLHGFSRQIEPKFSIKEAIRELSGLNKQQCLITNVSARAEALP